MAHVELSRNGTAAADRCLEQAVSGDFSIRSCTLFRLLTAQVRAQQNRADVAIPETEQLVQLMEVREMSSSTAIVSDGLSMYDEKHGDTRAKGAPVASAFDPLRLTDGILTHVSNASITSISWKIIFL